MNNPNSPWLYTYDSYYYNYNDDDSNFSDLNNDEIMIVVFQTAELPPSSKKALARLCGGAPLTIKGIATLGKLIRLN